MHDLLDIQLRFVEREGSTPRPDLGPNVADNRTVRILQTRRLQPARLGRVAWTEWQDVPLVAEEEGGV